VQAVQDQQAEIEALKAQNARLLQQNTSLQSQTSADHASLQTLQEQMARLLGEAPAGAQARK
jgi:cell division protein FtsB